MNGKCKGDAGERELLEVLTSGRHSCRASSTGTIGKLQGRARESGYLRNRRRASAAHRGQANRASAAFRGDASGEARRGKCHSRGRSPGEPSAVGDFAGAERISGDFRRKQSATKPRQKYDGFQGVTTNERRKKAIYDATLTLPKQAGNRFAPA